MASTPVLCGRCGRPIPGGDTAGAPTGPVFCPACLGKLPEASRGRRLESLRVSQGLTRLDLARLSGLSGSPIIAVYERGERRPHVRTVAKLARALDVQPVHLTAG
jgi:hypothetical protein